MLSFKCLSPGCDFEIEDGEHVEDVLQKLQVHYRAQHPRTYLRVGYICEEIERYNQTLEEFFTNHYGLNWQAQPANHLVRLVQQQILAPNGERYYGPPLRAEAQAYVDNNDQAVNANAQPVGAVDPVDFVDPNIWRPFPGPAGGL